MAKRNGTTRRREKEYITIEEIIWLFIGLSFGIFIGRGASFFLAAIPIAAFIGWMVWYFERKGLY